MDVAVQTQKTLTVNLKFSNCIVICNNFQQNVTALPKNHLS